MKCEKCGTELTKTNTVEGTMHTEHYPKDCRDALQAQLKTARAEHEETLRVAGAHLDDVQKARAMAAYLRESIRTALNVGWVSDEGVQFLRKALGTHSGSGG